MTKSKYRATILKLIQYLGKEGSWCGETHIQKATYFMKEATSVPLNSSFILYKHGPFSFDLRDELHEMYADDLLELKASHPYGHRYCVSKSGKELCKRFPKTLKKFDKPLKFVANTFGSRGVAQLERLSTALFVTQKLGPITVRERAERLNEIKPHIPIKTAKIAIVEVDNLLERIEKSQIRFIEQQ